MPNLPNLSHPEILKEFAAHRADERSESRAFLAWFLEHYYHLDRDAAQDCVCDGPDDKGIDGIFVDDNLERVDVFQAKLYQNTDKTVGERSLRDLAGALEQLTDAGKIEAIAKSTGNDELKNLIEHEKVAEKISDGYDLKGVFLTNTRADNSSLTFAARHGSLALFDSEKLSEGFISTGAAGPVSADAEFDIAGFDVIRYTTGEAKVIVAPLLGSELVNLKGIQSGELFDWNVRQSLGRTKVNKAISQSVQDQREHINFLLYHNGLTILTTELTYEGDSISLSGYSVVNGCQSLTSLHENREKITSDLRLLGRLIQVPPDSELAALITRHSNNQNSISARDLQSNSTLQRRLQNDIDSNYPGYFYEIKRGEVRPSDSPRTQITNEEAGRILLAFDLREPWTCHQTYKLFDELHNPIFARREVTGTRIVAQYQAYLSVQDVLPQVKLEVLAKYRLLRFFLLFLLRIALESDELGKSFCQDPSLFLDVRDGESRLRRCCAVILKDLVIDLNAEVDEREEDGNAFDYKRELKSPQSVRALQQSIIPMYMKAVARGRATSFGSEWEREYSVP